MVHQPVLLPTGPKVRVIPASCKLYFGPARLAQAAQRCVSRVQPCYITRPTSLVHANPTTSSKVMIHQPVLRPTGPKVRVTPANCNMYFGPARLAQAAQRCVSRIQPC